MSALKNDTFLRALMRQPTDYTPMWLMRQAGRYLPEYNATRARAGDFLTLCKTPDLATEVTLQPLARYPLDAAILFSDILTVPDAMGLGLYFAEGEGPRFERPLRDEWEIRDLSVPDPNDKLGYVMDAVRSIRRALDGSVPLIGFSGSPYTLACYMIEGGGSTDYRHIKTMLYSRPDLLHRILDINTQAVTAYLNAQIEAGAQAVMIFDSWGGSLTPHAYKEFSLAYMERIVAGLIKEREGRKVPSIVFTKGGGNWLEAIAVDRLRRRRPRLVDRHWRSPPPGGRQGRAARQPRPLRPARHAGQHPQRGCADHPGLRQSPRPCIQPRPWHIAVHRPGQRQRAGRGGAKPEPGHPRQGKN